MINSYDLYDFNNIHPDEKIKRVERVSLKNFTKMHFMSSKSK